MRILVTGAQGFIGHQAVRVLSEEHEVYGLVRRPVLSHNFLQGDITDYPRMLEIICDYEIDQIYHFAAKSIVRNCRVDPLGCLQANVMGTANILEAARQSERVEGIMCMESDKAYGPGPTPYLESQALLPSGIYEASKSCVGHLVRTYRQTHGLPVFGVRSANVYGPGDPNRSRVIPNTIARLLNNQSPQITSGASKFLREYIYIDDILSITQKLMAVGPWGQSVNVGTGETATVAKVVGLICNQMGKPFEPEIWDKPKTLTEIPEQSLDLRLLDKLGASLPAHVTLEQGIKKTIEGGDERR